MEKYEGQVRNSTTGQPVASPTITVRHAGTVVSATIYADEGTTTTANPITGDSQGRYSFYAPDGDYDLLIAGAGLTSYTLADVSITDKKRTQALTEYELYGLLANASYNRNTAAWNRKDVARPAWSVQTDADTGEDYLRVLRAAAAANPITWSELLRLNATGQLLAILGAAGTPSYSFTGDANTGVYSPGADLVSLAAGGVQVLQAALVASAVNYLRVRPAATTTPVLVDPQGSDANIGLDLLSKGTGVLRFFTNALERLRVLNAYQLRLNQATFGLILSWPDIATADRTLTLPDPGQNDDFVYRQLAQVLVSKAGVPFQWTGGAGANALATAGTEFLGITGFVSPDATEGNREIIAPHAASALVLRIRLATAPGAGTSRIFTLRVNGADTALAATIADTATTGSDTEAAGVAIAAGDRVCLKSTVTGTPAASLVQWGLRVRETAV